MSRRTVSRRVLFLCASLLFAGVLPVGPATAQITTPTALPVAQGEGIVRLQAKGTRATGDGPRNRELTAFGVPLVGVYGLTSRWTVFGAAPILDKNLDVTTPEGRVQRGPRGLGDVRLFARYTVWTRDRPGQTQRLAPLAGVETPTGEEDATDKLGRLPPPLQLGSGSWDPFVGLVFTWQALEGAVHAAWVYQVNTAANGFEFGDEVRLDVATKYRVWPRELRGGVPGFFLAVLETNLIWQGRHERNGTVLTNTGGTTWFVAPGLQYGTKRFVIGSAVQLPVVQDLNGSALGRDVIATLSLRVNI